MTCRRKTSELDKQNKELQYWRSKLEKERFNAMDVCRTYLNFMDKYVKKDTFALKVCMNSWKSYKDEFWRRNRIKCYHLSVKGFM